MSQKQEESLSFEKLRDPLSAGNSSNSTFIMGDLDILMDGARKLVNIDPTHSQFMQEFNDQPSGIGGAFQEDFQEKSYNEEPDIGMPDINVETPQYKEVISPVVYQEKDQESSCLADQSMQFVPPRPEQTSIQTSKTQKATIKALHSKKQSVSNKIKEIQKNANSLVMLIYEQNSSTELQKQQFQQRKNEAQESLEQLDKIKESLESKIQEQMADFNQFKEERELDLQEQLEPQSAQIRELQSYQARYEDQIQNINGKIDQYGEKIEQIELQVSLQQMQQQRDDQLLAVVEVEILNQMEKGGDHLKVFGQVCATKERLGELNGQIGKRQIELELNQSIQKKFKNTLNFINEARQVIISQKENKHAQENKHKVLQIERNLEGQGLKEQLLDAYTHQSQALLQKRETEILRGKLTDLQHEKDISVMILNSLHELDSSNESVARVIQELTSRINSLRAKVKVLTRHLRSQGSYCEEALPDEMLEDYDFIKVFAIQQAEAESDEGLEQFYLNLMQLYRSCIIESYDSFSKLKSQYHEMQAQGIDIKQTLNILSLHHSLLSDSLQSLQSKLAFEKKKRGQLVQLLQKVELKVSERYFQEYLSKHSSQIERVIRLYGKQHFEKKKEEQLQQFHALHRQKLQKDYEVVRLLFEKKQSISKDERQVKRQEEYENKQRVYFIKKKAQLQKLRRSELEEKVKDIQLDIDSLNNEVQQAFSLVERELQEVLDEEDKKYGVKEVQTKLQEIVSSQNALKAIVSQCASGLDQLIEQESRNIERQKQAREKLRLNQDRLEQKKEDIEIQLFKAEMGVPQEDSTERDYALDPDSNSFLDDINDENVNVMNTQVGKFSNSQHLKRGLPNDKLRAIFKPFNEIYEIQDLDSRQQRDLITSLLPLLEGFRIQLVRKQKVLSPIAQRKREHQSSERLIRLSSDLSRVEIRMADGVFKLDRFVKVNAVQSIIVSQQTKNLLKKLQITLDGIYSPSKSQARQTQKAKTFQAGMKRRNSCGVAYTHQRHIDLHNSIYHQKNDRGMATLKQSSNRKKALNQLNLTAVNHKNMGDFSQSKIASKNFAIDRSSQPQSPQSTFKQSAFEFTLICDKSEVEGEMSDFQDFRKFFEAMRQLTAKKETLCAMIARGEISKKLKIFKF